MDWNMIAALAAIGGIFVTVLASAHNHGQMKQMVLDGKEQLDKLGKRVDSIDDRTGENEVAIGRLKEWQSGYRKPVSGTP